MAAVEAANQDVELQKLILTKCMNDCVTWINDWVWTYDPRKKPANIPFVLFPRQIEYLEWRTALYQKRTDGLVEKSRDMGVTWLNIAWQVHQWLFEEGFKGTFGSRKEDLVDKKGDPDSIFEKMRMLLRSLPVWMLPAGFSWKECDNHLRLINPANGAAITGEGGDNIGRGGRSSIVDLDEAAFIEHPQSVDAALSQNTDCIIYTSTPCGLGNPFAQKRFAWDSKKIFTFHWRDDPRKDDAWYQEQKKRLDAVVIAQEIDIDYAASVDRVVVPKPWVDPARSRELYFEERKAFAIGGDVARGGADRSALVIRQGRNLLEMSDWSGNDLMECTGNFIAAGIRYESQLRIDDRLHFFIDVVGLGAGVVDRLRQYIQDTDRGRKWVVNEVHAGSRSTDSRCERKRDELWIKAREFFENQKPAASKVIERSIWDKFTTEMAGPTYRISPRGLFKVEGKDELKSRGVASPNLADAFIHTLEYEVSNPADEVLPSWTDSYSGEQFESGWI